MLKIKNWSEYQHYKNRCPPWIKLHAKILNDKDFTTLSCASRGLLMQLWILGSENDGEIENDINEIKFRLRDNTIKQEHVNVLINKGFLIDDKQVLADASAVQAGAVPEGETEGETEGEKRQSKKEYLDTVTLTEDQHKTLVDKYGFHSTTKAIVVLNNYKASSGKKYKSDYHAILSWAMEKAGGKPKEKPVPLPPCPECQKKPCVCVPLTEAEMAFNRNRAKGILEGLK